MLCGWAEGQRCSAQGHECACALCRGPCKRLPLTPAVPTAPCGCTCARGVCGVALPGAQVNGLLELSAAQQGARKYDALAKWANQIGSLHAAVQNRLGS